MNMAFPGVQASPNDMLDFLAGLFDRAENLSYGTGTVSMCAHMLQTADLAAADDASPKLVAAALLHDLGHFGTDFDFEFPDGSHTAMQAATDDKRHEDAGANMVRPFFGAEVAEPIRLHVPAKRYLCAIDTAYLDGLTETTRHTLGLQGGPMSADETKSFGALPFAAEAARLRRWDDLAMAADRVTTPFEDYRGLLEDLMAKCNA